VFDGEYQHLCTQLTESQKRALLEVCSRTSEENLELFQQHIFDNIMLKLLPTKPDVETEQWGLKDFT
jgi:hypothetical protein